MDIKDIPQVNTWLKQFDIPDVYLAEYMLKKMRYVSFEEFEQWLQNAILTLVSDIQKKDGKAAIAIFTVSKPSINQFNKDKDTKKPNDSEGRMAHALQNLERRLPKGYIELNPRVISMKDRKVKHIIYVDDFIGTGNRFVKSWRETVSPSIKSWCSHGWCKVWFLSFAGHEKGIKYIINNIKPMVEERICVNLRIKDSFILENKSLSNILIKYGTKLEKEKSKLGYGNIASPVIFQHGCPNNAPGIFWSKGKSKKIPWYPLFPDRSIATEVYHLFSSNINKDVTADELWMLNKYELALQFMDNVGGYHGGQDLLMILAFLNNNKSLEKIRNVMVLTENEFNKKLLDLSVYGLIDVDNTVTRFGKEILKRGGKKNQPKVVQTTGDKYFYPSTFLGFQREI